MQGIIDYLWGDASLVHPEESDYYLVSDGEDYAIAYYVKRAKVFSITNPFWKGSDVKYWTKFQKLNLEKK